LGIDDEEALRVLKDPVSDATFLGIWQATATHNRECYLPLLEINADDLHGVVAEGGLKIGVQTSGTATTPGGDTTEAAILVTEAVVVAILSKSKGHLVPFPIHHQFDSEILFEAVLPSVVFQ
jgi:hypothetical protein